MITYTLDKIVTFLRGKRAWGGSKRQTILSHLRRAHKKPKRKWWWKINRVCKIVQISKASCKRNSRKTHYFLLTNIKYANTLMWWKIINYVKFSSPAFSGPREDVTKFVFLSSSANLQFFVFPPLHLENNFFNKFSSSWKFSFESFVCWRAQQTIGIAAFCGVNTRVSNQTEFNPQNYFATHPKNEKKTTSSNIFQIISRIIDCCVQKLDGESFPSRSGKFYRKA